VQFKGGLRATVQARDGAEAMLAFETGGRNFFAALDEAGVMPLPPYIARKRPAGDEDKESYQTMFADEAGSVAAPTAGLHFTPELIAALKEKGASLTTITLHVGAGTFLPVSADDTVDHKMHSEWGEITEAQAAQINETRRNGGRIVAVGTTSLRLLESAAGDDGVVKPFARETDIFITPGYKFKAVDMLMTNFHLPRSTLFMLACAFAGTEAMKTAYAHAIEEEYRFYSYGDACLLERAS
jgi:S-adenosylmethionine:tRNA ribosyltransferase-isomerase